MGYRIAIQIIGFQTKLKPKVFCMILATKRKKAPPTGHFVSEVNN